MNDKHSTGPVIVLVVLLVVAFLFGIVLLVGAAGIYWYRVKPQRTLQAEEMAERAETIAEEESKIARKAEIEAKDAQERAMFEAERARKAEADAVQAQQTAIAEAERARKAERTALDAKERANRVQEQFDEARRMWKAIIERTGGQLTDEDVAAVEAEFAKVQERLKEMDEVFR